MIQMAQEFKKNHGLRNNQQQQKFQDSHTNPTNVPDKENSTLIAQKDNTPFLNQRKGISKPTSIIQHEQVQSVISQVKEYHDKGKEEYDKKKKLEDQGWDLKFQNLLDFIIKSQTDMNRNFQLCERLLDHVRAFKEQAAIQVKKIVDQLHSEILLSPNQDDNMIDLRKSNLTNSRQTSGLFNMKPLTHDLNKQKLDQLGSDWVWLFCDENQQDSKDPNDHLIFFDPEHPELTNNLVIKLTHQRDFIQYSKDEQFQGGATNQNVTNFDQGSLRGVETSSKGGNRHFEQRSLYKQYSRELLAYDVILDALLYNATPDKNTSLRVPLICKVDYKGFRAVVIPFINFDTQTGLMLGYKKDQSYMIKDNNESIYQTLRNVGIILNLKENRLQPNIYQQQIKRIPLSSFIQVYQYTKREEGNENQEDDVIKSFFEFHFKELEFTNETMPHYIFKASEIFPYDIDPKDSNMDDFHRDRVLRPELVCANEKSLRADTKKVSKYAKKNLITKQNSAINNKNQASKDENEQDNTDAVDLNMANQFLRNNKIPQLVDLLDNLIIIPLDSATLQRAFHILGVNMRYLGEVAMQSKLKHVKDLCITDMVARTLKRTFNSQISFAILNQKKRKKDILKEIQEIEMNLSNKTLSFRSSEYGGLHYMNNTLRKQIQDEIAAQKDIKKQLEAELKKLDEPMEDRINEWIIDFLNLIFGNSEETQAFWNEVIYPEVTSYYGYPYPELRKYDKNLNALYFALIEQMGLKISRKNRDQKRYGIYFSNNENSTGITQSNQEEQPFHKGFEKEENPFGNKEKNMSPYQFELVPKSKTYKFRNLNYYSMAQKFRDFKNNGKIEQAFSACKMRKHMSFCLNGPESEIQTRADLCKLQLEEQQWDSAEQMATNAMKYLKDNMLDMHAIAIQFQCVLIQACYMKDETQNADAHFNLALEILDHHWGPYHPLHINIYGVMAQLLILNGKYEDATFLYKASLRCCMRVLGPNHIQTGEVHMDYAGLQLQKSKNSLAAISLRNDSLQHFMEAYQIFENYFGDNDQDKDALQKAEAAIQIAQLLEEDNRLEEAYKMAKIAAQTYSIVYAEDNALRIKALWQELSIQYSIETGEKLDEQMTATLKLATQLFYALAKRDHILQFQDIQTYDMVQKNKQLNIALNQQVNAFGQDDKIFTLNQKQQDDLGSKNMPKDPFKKEIEKIKSNCIATIIMEYTRRLDDKQKKELKEYCDKILFYKVYKSSNDHDFNKKKELIITDLKTNHHSNLNIYKIQSVRDLDQKLNDHARELLELYNKSQSVIDWSRAETQEVLASRQKVFLTFYQGIIQQACASLTLERGEGDQLKNKILDIGDSQEKSQETLAGGVRNNNQISGIQNENENYDDFMLRLVGSTFKTINFYNLLYIKPSRINNAVQSQSLI